MVIKQNELEFVVDKTVIRVYESYIIVPVNYKIKYKDWIQYECAVFFH